jgi:hypothetical protein
MAVMRPEGHSRRESVAEGWPIGVVSFKLGDRWICHVDNISPGAVIARADGSTREEAEEEAIALASRRLRTTRRLKTTLADLHDSVARLDAIAGRKPDDDDD